MEGREYAGPLQPITTPADCTNENAFNQRRGNQFVKSAGVVIGWNEDLHILGPPWHDWAPLL